MNSNATSEFDVKKRWMYSFQIDTEGNSNMNNMSDGA